VAGPCRLGLGTDCSIANLSDQLTPMLVIAAAVFWTKAGQDLTVAEAFTVLSITLLVSGPLTNVIASYPTLMSSVGCFDRIRAFLLSAERKDYRCITKPRRATRTLGSITGVGGHVSTAVELRSDQENSSASAGKGAEPIITLLMLLTRTSPTSTTGISLLWGVEA